MKIKSRYINSIPGLLEYSLQWNELWQSSNATLPTLRAEPLANFVESFGYEKAFAAVVVENDDDPIAALPLVLKKRIPGFRLANSPTNEWNTCGELLVREGADIELVTECIIRKLRDADIDVLSLDWVNYESSTWRGFFEYLSHQGIDHYSDFQFNVGVINTARPWNDYFPKVSKTLRKRLRNAGRKLDSAGGLEFCSYTDHCDSRALEKTVRSAFEIEDRSWKGEKGSSVLQSKGILDFYLRQAIILAEQEMFELDLLKVDGQPIAFEFGYLAKNVFFSHKVGYDPAFAKQSPGHLLMSIQLQKYFDCPRHQLVDTMGILSDATSKWTTGAYRLGRCTFSTGSLIGNSAVKASRSTRRVYRKLRGRDTSIPAAKIGVPMPTQKTTSTKQSVSVGSTIG